MNFKFVHAADLHLDSPFRGLRTQGHLHQVFRDATLVALSRIVDLCLREHVDFLVLAGDLFDTKDRSVRARLHLRHALLKLDEAGIRTFIVHGNHDPLSDGAALDLPSSVKVFGASWEEVPVHRGDAVLCRVQGVSYPEEKVTADLSRAFHRVGPEFTIGLLHANVGGQRAHANYAPCTLGDLSERNLDYWALGHVHTRADFELDGGGRAAYPGNPQGRHINESGERGCLLVEVNDGRVQSRFVPTDSVRWHRESLDLANHLTLEALVSAMEDRVDAVCRRELAGHAVRFTLEGRGPVHAQLLKPGALAELEQGVAESLKKRTPPVLLEAVVDASLPELDLDAIRKAGGLGALVLELASDSATTQGLWESEDMKKLEAALRKVSLPGLTDGAQEWVDRAAERAVWLLSEGDVQ